MNVQEIEVSRLRLFRNSGKVLRWIGKSALAELVIPPECAFCQAPLPSDHAKGSQRLCDACDQVLAAKSYCCQRCAMPLPSVLPNNDCSRCRDHRWHFSNIVALGHYRGKLREAVILCKKLRCEHLRYALAEQLAKQIISRFPESSSSNSSIVPVPYHWTRTFAKTAATAHSLAELLGYHTGWPVSTKLVRRVRRTAKQGMLSLTERKQNVHGAFQLRSKTDLAGRHLFVVDDVVTSGATVDELAKQLKRTKPAEITVVAIARATGS